MTTTEQQTHADCVNCGQPLDPDRTVTLGGRLACWTCAHPTGPTEETP